MKCTIEMALPTEPVYAVHFEGLTELEAVILRCLVSDSAKYREKATEQVRTLKDFREVMDGQVPLCTKYYDTLGE